MKKANIKQLGRIYENVILIENIEDLHFYFDSERESKHKDTLKSFLENNETDTNISNIEKYALLMQEKTGRGGIHFIADMESKTRTAMTKYTCMGFTLMVNNAGGWCLVDKSAVIDRIESRKPNISDIKLSRFKNGKHWYARVGFVNVEVDGEYKWNARWVAQKKAEEFLSKM